MRRLLHRVGWEITAVLRRQRPGSPPNLQRRAQIETALTELLTQDRTWTAAQLAEALGERKLALSARQVRRYLTDLRSGYRRTVRTLHHRQDPVRVQQAKEDLAAYKKKKAATGELTLVFLDECGFSPSQPVNYSWTLPGQRKYVPYENPCGRRINAVGLLIPDGPEPCLIWDHVPRSIRSDDILALLEGIPRRGVPIVVVLDNATTHRSKVIPAAQAELAAQQIEFYYLPPYSPELNALEAVFGGIKHHDLPERRYADLDQLYDASNQAFTQAEARLIARPAHELRPAA